MTGLRQPPGRCAASGRDSVLGPVSGTAAKIKETWLIPLGAAALVAALALALVTLRHGAARPPAPAQTSTVAPAATGIPRYSAIASEGPVSHGEMAAVNVTVGDVDTGKTLATVALPAVSEMVGTNAAVGVSAAADDRTFVVARRNIYGGITYFLMHIAPGKNPAATVAHLPIPDADPGALLGFAVSPDDKELAVLSARGAGCGTNGPMYVAYSAVTGQRLRVIYQYSGACQSGVETVLWSDDSAQHVVGESQLSVPGNQPRETDQYGVTAAGSFATFPVAQHGQWYSGPAF
jgi:hypothetical protein